VEGCFGRNRATGAIRIKCPFRSARPSSTPATGVNTLESFRTSTVAIALQVPWLATLLVVRLDRQWLHRGTCRILEFLAFLFWLHAIFPARSGTGADVITFEIIAAFCTEWDAIEQRECKAAVFGLTNRAGGYRPSDTGLEVPFGALNFGRKQKWEPAIEKSAQKLEPEILGQAHNN